MRRNCHLFVVVVLWVISSERRRGNFSITWAQNCDDTETLEAIFIADFRSNVSSPAGSKAKL